MKLKFPSEVFKEISWVARCRSYDIATQGETKKDALQSLERVILAQIAIDLESGNLIVDCNSDIHYIV